MLATGGERREETTGDDDEQGLRVTTTCQTPVSGCERPWPNVPRRYSGRLYFQSPQSAISCASRSVQHTLNAGASQHQPGLESTRTIFACREQISSRTTYRRCFLAVRRISATAHRIAARSRARSESTHRLKSLQKDDVISTLLSLSQLPILKTHIFILKIAADLYASLDDKPHHISQRHGARVDLH